MKTRIVPFVAVVLFAVTGLAQSVSVGEILPQDNFGTSINGGLTEIDLNQPATNNGTLTTAAVRWEGFSGPCTNGFKLRFYRSGGNNLLFMTAERGPFAT